ncbi:MAG: hypothetical protein R3E03_06830 [Novosphingobium sp.]
MGEAVMNWFAIRAGAAMIPGSHAQPQVRRLGWPASLTLAAVGALFLAKGAGWL